MPPPAPAEGKIVAIDPRLYDAYVGRYEFGPGAVLNVTREGNRLFVESTGGSDVYSFRLKQKEELFPVSDTDFFSRNRRGDRLRFAKDGKNNVSALTLNPGRWGLPARKIQ